MSTIDQAVTFNVLGHALRAAVAEMGMVLVRSAYSPIVREAKDGATCLLNADGRVVALTSPKCDPVKRLSPIIPTTTVSI